jgi:hypothetical protein
MRFEFLKANLVVCINSINKAFANGLLTLIDQDLGIQSLIILKTALCLLCSGKSLSKINQFFKYTISNYHMVRR